MNQVQWAPTACGFSFSRPRNSISTPVVARSAWRRPWAGRPAASESAGAVECGPAALIETQGGPVAGGGQVPALRPRDPGARGRCPYRPRAWAANGGRDAALHGAEDRRIAVHHGPAARLSGTVSWRRPRPAVNELEIAQIQGGFDLALRNAVLTDSGLKVRKLAGDTRMLCPSSAYLAWHGTAQRLAAAARHQLTAL